MQVSSLLASPRDVSSGWIACGIFEGESAPAEFPGAGLLARLIESKDVTGAIGEAVPLHGSGPGGGSILVFGLGKKAKFDAAAAYSAGVATSRKLAAKPREKVSVTIPSERPELISALVEGLIVGTAGPGIRKKEAARHPFGMLEIVAPPGFDAEALKRAVERGRIVGEAINLARELVNTPPSEKPPHVFAEKARVLAAEAGLEVEVWDETRLEAERFGGLLAVSAGSEQPPRFVQLHHRKGGDRPAIALVGKGVTFDSGGLSLKPSASMEDMKCDMAGAAAVLSALVALARLDVPVNATGYFALTENMTGGRAMKLGDVLTARNGTTIEVLNTDAEGRLILADVLSYAVEKAPASVVDLATLTGACMVALGPRIAGLFANDDALARRIDEASKAAGERCWRMPLDQDFDDAIKSKVADIRNVGGKWGGAITAAKFLQRFVGETPWAHLDIAGPAWSDDESASRDAGGTGAFVRTLVALAQSS